MSNDIFKHVAIEDGEGGAFAESSTAPASEPTDTTTGGGSSGGTGAAPGTGTGQSVTYVKFGDIGPDRVYRTATRRNKISYTTSNENVTLVDATWLYRNPTTFEWAEIIVATYNPRGSAPAAAPEPFLSRKISHTLGCSFWFVLTCN